MIVRKPLLGIGLGLATEWIEILRGRLTPCVSAIVSVLRPSGLKCQSPFMARRATGLGLATEWIEIRFLKLVFCPRSRLGLATEWIEIINKQAVLEIIKSRSCDRVD